MDSSASGTGLSLKISRLVTYVWRIYNAFKVDLDSMEGDGEYWNKSYSTIYIFVPAKSALYIRVTNHSAINTRATNHSASDIKFTATVLAFLPGLIIYEQQYRARKITGQVRNVVTVYVGARSEVVIRNLHLEIFVRGKR